MKKTAISALLLVAAGASVAFAAPRTGVVGSVHDMRVTGVGAGTAADGQNRVCAYCHTPHHAAKTGATYLPLWSHDISTFSHTPYWSATLQSDSVTSDFLVGPSKLCMSCHDGSVAVDQHYGLAGSKNLSGDNFRQANVGDAGVGGSSLSNDHPIGFDYTAVAAGSKDVPGTDTTGTKDNYINKADTDWYYKGNTANITIAERLYNGTHMTCATCHDVHNKKNADLDGTQNYLVLGAQDGSKLCLTCHIK